MRYEFTVRAATGAAAKEQVAAKLDEIIAAEPVHAPARSAALAAAGAMIDLVPDADAWDGWDLLVQVSGSLAGGTTGDLPADMQLVDPTGAALSVKVSRDKAKA